jgi:hypothetical protein
MIPDDETCANGFDITKVEESGICPVCGEEGKLEWVE